ncbi:PP2C family protein-serine/threonine phosphatase [Streptomyces sp. NPDC050617]|uniref:PP2C family protein-serine/threonine phosphatase n=1 Tax=Streptomyces sp. NPDC050617 TaxID=3154628 RepID=UPI00341FA980
MSARPSANGLSRRAVIANRLALWLPAVLIVGGVLFDVLTPPKYTGAPFLSAAPLVAAPLFGRRGTAAVAVAAVAAAAGTNAYHRAVNSFETATKTATVLTVAILALGINRIVRRSDQQLESARGIAEAAQRAVLPTPPASIGVGLCVAARYVAAQADARIGGDLYAVQDTPHGVRVIVGDVRGKGLEAVEAVAVVIGAFREAAEQEATLEALAARLERALQREGARREGLDQFEGFTTAVLAEVAVTGAEPGAGSESESASESGAVTGVESASEPVSGPESDGAVLRVVNRGHPPPLLLYADGKAVEASPEVPALPLGMGDLGVWPDRVDVWDFPAGTTLLLFTDGVTEARDERGVFYDPQARLNGRLFDGPDLLLEELAADVARHTGGGTSDDMALLAIRRGGSGGGGAGPSGGAGRSGSAGPSGGGSAGPGGSGGGAGRLPGAGDREHGA